MRFLDATRPAREGWKTQPSKWFDVAGFPGAHGGEAGLRRPRGAAITTWLNALGWAGLETCPTYYAPGGRLAQFSSDIFRVNCMAASGVVEVPISVSR